MIYSLTVTIAAGLLFLGVIVIAVALARRVADSEDWPSFRGWSWRPSPLGLLLLPLAAILLLRFSPGLIFIPFVLPFVWRRFGRRGRSFFARDDGNDTIEGSSRPYRDN